MGLPLLVGNDLLRAAGARFDLGGALHYCDAIFTHSQHQGTQGLQGHVVIPADGGQLVLTDDLDMLAEILSVDLGGNITHPPYGVAQGEIGTDHQVEVEQQADGQRRGDPPEVALVGGQPLMQVGLQPLAYLACQRGDSLVHLIPQCLHLLGGELYQLILHHLVFHGLDPLTHQLYQSIGLLTQLGAVGRFNLVEQGQIGLQLLQSGVDKVETKTQAAVALGLKQAEIGDGGGAIPHLSQQVAQLRQPLAGEDHHVVGTERRILDQAATGSNVLVEVAHLGQQLVVAQVALLHFQLARFALQGGPALFDHLKGGVVLAGVGKGLQALINGLRGCLDLIITDRIHLIGVTGHQIAMGEQGLLDSGHGGEIGYSRQLAVGLDVVILQPPQQIGHAVGQWQQHQAGPEQEFVFEGELVAQPDGGVENPFHVKPRYLSAGVSRVA